LQSSFAAGVGADEENFFGFQLRGHPDGSLATVLDFAAGPTTLDVLSEALHFIHIS